MLSLIYGKRFTRETHFGHEICLKIKRKLRKAFASLRLYNRKGFGKGARSSEARQCSTRITYSRRGTTQFLQFIFYESSQLMLPVVALSFLRRFA
jgi:hypothetical protein